MFQPFVPYYVVYFGDVFIGPKSDNCLLLSVTHSCLVNFIDVTLTFKDANSKLVDVVSADVDAEERVDDSLIEMLKFCKLSYLG